LSLSVRGAELRYPGRTVHYVGQVELRRVGRLDAGALSSLYPFLARRI